MVREVRVLKNRIRVIDTFDARQLIDRRFKPITEDVDYYTKCGSYDKNTRNVEIDDRVFLTPSYKHLTEDKVVQ